MEARLDYGAAAPGAMKAMYALQRYTDHCGLEGTLMDLVRLRASQINGCGYCIDMHFKDARAAGVSEQRLYGLDAWQEAPYYSERERAALLWTETLTRIADTRAPDAVYAQVRPHFTDEELVNLTMVIVTINSWNRLAIGFRDVPGSYERAQNE